MSVAVADILHFHPDGGFKFGGRFARLFHDDFSSGGEGFHQRGEQPIAARIVTLVGYIGGSR